MTIKPELKIIADHLRSSCFLIADGVLPSNEGRGYVLRRIMRRAMRQLHKLGAKEASMYKLVDSLIKEMGEAYPELARARDTIIDSLKNEEEKFRETLGKGLKILEEEIPQTKNNLFSGQVAFKLYDTYGFPLDLTQDILKEKNITVDIKTFDEEMESQRQRARKSWAGSGENQEDNIFFELKEKFGNTEFLGYDNIQSNATILAIEEIPGTTQKIIILNQTPFYGTSGGQKGDDGKIILASNAQNYITISETKKFAGNLLVHLVKEMKGEFNVNDEVIAQVNAKSRQLRANNHSATHLLHKALKELVGNSISQKGSNVDDQYLTFDFNLNRGLTKEELSDVENLVNFYIQQNSSIKTQLMDLEKARNSGAQALFGEKYDDEVRVLSMGHTHDGYWSVELCGGTHAKATGDIGLFKIVSEKAIAAGIRRMEAKTGQVAIDYIRKSQSALEEKIELLQQDAKDKFKEIEKLKKKILLSGLHNLKSETIGNVKLLSHVFEDVDAKDLREIANQIKAKKDYNHGHVFALFGNQDNKVAVIVAASDDLIDQFDASQYIRPVVEAVGGKGGGGKKDLAMGGGSNINGAKQAIENLKSAIIDLAI